MKPLIRMVPFVVARALAALAAHDVVFLGDSITEGRRGAGKEVWAKCYGPLKAANFGNC